MIKAIVFDWFGVCTTENWGDCVQRELVKSLKVEPEKIKKEYKLLLQDYMKAKISSEEFFKRLIAALDQKKDPKEFYYLTGVLPSLNEELLQLILALKKEYKIYLLSNTTKEFFEQYQKKINFNQYFDRMFLSHQLKMSKTQEEIWHLLLSKIDFLPEEILFIDNTEKYLETAQKFGVKTILFENNEQMRKELAALGIKTI